MYAVDSLVYTMHFIWKLELETRNYALLFSVELPYSERGKSEL